MEGLPVNMICFDLEGVLVPEIWIAFAEKTGIPELRLTTRDVADYHELMTHRLKILKEHNLKVQDIQEVIATMSPLPGAQEYMAWLSARYPNVIISDTFYEFAMPLMKKLGFPMLMCNALEVSDEGKITGYRLRCAQSKLTTVKALQSCGFETIAAGDSFNDLGMIRASKAGFLFRSTEKIKADNPDLPVIEDYGEFLKAIVAAL
jgi:phosphoserine/homoserine phosphotransferase